MKDDVNKNKKKKNKKTVYVDDGHTVYDMSLVQPKISTDDKKTVSVTKGEKRAMIKAAFAYYLPIFLGAAACFFAAAWLVWLWLQ